MALIGNTFPNISEIFTAKAAQARECCIGREAGQMPGPLFQALSGPYPGIVFWRTSELPPSQLYIISIMAALMHGDRDQAFSWTLGLMVVEQEWGQHPCLLWRSGYQGPITSFRVFFHWWQRAWFELWRSWHVDGVWLIWWENSAVLQPLWDVQWGQEVFLDIRHGEGTLITEMWWEEVGKYLSDGVFKQRLSLHKVGG